ncbi:MAG: hypothetical protein WAR76_03520 [Xanthobacteraceae bacterium]
MKPLLVLFALCLSAATALVQEALVQEALAQEPVGCDKFKWPLDKERATLAGSDLPKLASGSRVQWPLPFATTVTLLPFSEVKLSVAPERVPKSNNSFAGFIEAPAPAQSGTYKITLSSEGWIDVVQDGERIKSIAATGATGCDGVRKSVKFELAKTPFTVQFSGIEAGSVGVAISRE